MKVTLLIVVVLTITCSNCKSLFLKLSEIDITNLELIKCDSDNLDPVSVSNITMRMGENKQIHLSGTLSTSEDLVAPVKASVTLKKKVLFGWIPIPCEKKIGSCDYLDLCSYGYPEDKKCPPEFIQNGVPCRCPIKKGTYTLPPTAFQLSDERDMLQGKYKGNVLLSHQGERLSCYNMRFVIKEK